MCVRRYDAIFLNAIHGLSIYPLEFLAKIGLILVLFLRGFWEGFPIPIITAFYLHKADKVIRRYRRSWLVFPSRIRTSTKASFLPDGTNQAGRARFKANPP